MTCLLQQPSSIVTKIIRQSKSEQRVEESAQWPSIILNGWRENDLGNDRKYGQNHYFLKPYFNCA